jgi:hypothetical protein
MEGRMAKLVSTPELQVKEIDDPYLRNNFQKLVDYFAKQNQLLNFQFLDVEFTAAEVKRRVLHGLGVLPRDFVRLEVSGTGKATLHRDLFTKDALFISADGPVRLRFLCGLYWRAESGGLSSSTEDWQAAYASEVTETPQGTVDGTNKIFVLANEPKNLKLFYDGKFQRLSTHYTLEGKTITFVTAPASSKLVDAVYNV